MEVTVTLTSKQSREEPACGSRGGGRQRKAVAEGRGVREGFVQRWGGPGTAGLGACGTLRPPGGPSARSMASPRDGAGLTTVWEEVPGWAIPAATSGS